MKTETKGKLIKILSKARGEIRELYYKKEITIEESIKFQGLLLRNIKELVETKT